MFLRSILKLHNLWREGVASGSVEMKSCPFALRQKSHMLQHLIEEHVAVFGSPTKFWCYRDEDFVGSIKDICSRTKHPSTLEARVLQKVRILEGLGIAV